MKRMLMDAGQDAKEIYPEAPAAAKSISYAVSRRPSSVIPLEQKWRYHSCQRYVQLSSKEYM